jgi:hypothetical protein
MVLRIIEAHVPRKLRATDIRVPHALSANTIRDSTELTPHAMQVSRMSPIPATVSATTHEAAASMVLTHIEETVPRALTIIEMRVPQKLRDPAITVPRALRPETQRSCNVVSTVSMASHMMSNSARGTKLAHQLQQPDNRDFRVLKTLTTRDSAMPRHDAKMPPSAPQNPPVSRPAGREKQRVVQKFIGVSIMKLHIPP